MRIDFALSPEQRADARAALKALDGSGISLAEAARRAIHGRRALRRITFEQAVEEFILSRLRADARPRTIEWYEQKLAFAGAHFAEKALDDIDRKAIRAWVDSLNYTQSTKAGFVRALRALWNWGMGQEPQLVSVDATAGLASTARVQGGNAEILTVEECAAILRNAGPYRSGIALLLFAGLRPEELHGRGKDPLLWSAVTVADRLVRIPENISKTRKARPMEGLPATLWEWLQPGEANEAITPGRTRQALRRAQDAIAPREWPHDATRHTFATYALAFTGDPSRVAYWLGHEGNAMMLHRHYRGLTTKAEAEKFWALRPTGVE